MKKSYPLRSHEIDFQCEKEAEPHFLETTTGNVTYETHKKRKHKEKEQEHVKAENVSCLCSVTWESVED